MALPASSNRADLLRSPASAKHPVFLVDKSGRIRFVNAEAEEMLGYGAAALGGTPLSDYILYSGHGVDTVDLFHFDCDQPINNPFDIEVDLLTSSGAAIHSVLSISPVRDHAEQPVYFAVLVDHQQTNRRLEQERDEDRRKLDPLTNLLNRSEFERRLDILIEDAGVSARTHALIYIDLDQFRLINDTSGHRAGDELLCKVAQVLSESLAHGEVAARLGGDEFAVLLSNRDHRESLLEARRLHRLIRRVSFSWENRVHKVDASLGVVTIDEHSHNRSATMIQADAALFAAKEKGRGRVLLYRAADEKLARIRTDMEWVSILNKALLSDSFHFVQQPILSLAGESDLRFCEVLLRLGLGDDEISAPASFLAAAERFGLALNIDQWVIEHFFDFLEQHPELNHRGMLYTVNLSGDSICQENFLDYVLKQLHRFHVLPEIICFEITETAAISNFDAACRFIGDVRALGCRFALDDFGSGMSSFGYLNELSVDFVKIDGQFVRDMDTNALHEVIVRSVTDICHTMGIQVIAEFVENCAVSQQLRDMGVDCAQGYYLGMPEALSN